MPIVRLALAAAIVQMCHAQEWEGEDAMVAEPAMDWGEEGGDWNATAEWEGGWEEGGDMEAWEDDWMNDWEDDWHEDEWPDDKYYDDEIWIDDWEDDYWDYMSATFVATSAVTTLATVSLFSL